MVDKRSITSFYAQINCAFTKPKSMHVLGGYKIDEPRGMFASGNTDPTCDEHLMEQVSYCPGNNDVINGWVHFRLDLGDVAKRVIKSWLSSMRTALPYISDPTRPFLMSL
jgi:hypothetical protein